MAVVALVMDLVGVLFLISTQKHLQTSPTNKGRLWTPRWTCTNKIQVYVSTNLFISSELVRAQVAENWRQKEAEGTEVQVAGENTRVKGINSARQIEKIEDKAVMKAIGEGAGQNHENYAIG